MDNLLIHYLNKMLEMEEGGYINEAIILADKICETFPEDRTTILLEKGKMEFRNGHEKKALIDLIKAYEISKNDEIFHLILEAYYLPNKLKMNTIFLKNKELLNNYPHYRNEDIDNISDILPIWQDDEDLIWIDYNEKNFIVNRRKIGVSKGISKNEVILLANQLWLDVILECVKCSGIESPFLDEEYPIYLVYDRKSWILFMQIVDITALINIGRIVFLVGQQKIIEYFNEDMVLFPTKSNYDTLEKDGELLITDTIFNNQLIEYNKNIKEIVNYYQNKKDEINEHIKAGKPRILFCTSRFTTILQYHTRDCMSSMKELGCETRLIIEPDGLHRINNNILAKYVMQLKPDIIFSIDHFRFESCKWIPKEIVWVTWIQDYLPYILDKETPSKLTDRDFIMNHFITWKEIEKIGYPSSRMMDAPVVANKNIYKPYILTKTEKQEYEAEICMVCHGSDIEGIISSLLHNFEKNIELKKIVEQLLYDYCQLVISDEFILHTKDEIYEFINEYIKQFYNIRFNENFISALGEFILLELNQNIYRQAMADWLIEAGYTNLKLWGNGWLKNPKYTSYAMGPAQNGEILSKILQSTKIVLGNNILGTGAARAWESMLSGAFYMSNYVPPEVDIVDIRKIMREGEDLVMFHDKQDLLNKVNYYLSHETERKQMAEKGRQAALKTMTYNALMRRLLEFLKNSLHD